MSRSSRHREKHAIKSEIFRDNCNEETAARTRPFSFDEIMLRRKNKKQSGKIEATPGEAGTSAGKVSKGEVLDRSQSGRGYGNSSDSLSVVAKHPSEDFVKPSSRNKEDDTYMSRDKLVKKKDKEIRDPEGKPKSTLNKDVGDKTKRDKDERRGHGSRKYDDRSNGNFENEYEKRHSRLSVEKERFADKIRGKSGKEIKRKDRNDDNERSIEKNSVKKHDLGKRHDSEILEKKERKESSRFHNEESRSKKKRSRSREHDKGRGRRSPSLSPRSRRRTSDNAREHGEMSSHSSKDRFRRQQVDDEGNRIANNGSSGHYRKHGGSASGLGGYSPRRRRTEAGVKTPSPPHRSPEKKSAGWDLPPPGANTNSTGSVLPNVQPLNQTVTSNTYELPSIAPVTSTTVRALPGFFSYASVDSVQLTQATRPMRRLYVENLPSSASEKTLMECLNSFLLSSGVNRIPGAQPCISCSIHKEKGQALVEFLTPEDASVALSFDGRSFSGSVLKIRRPKDYVEVATGVADKSVPAFDSISDIVRDSPHKIFIGGIPKVISYEMLREIVTAFGPLKAFRFEFNVDLDEPCAFLEYADQSVTLKACAGLNALRLGGQMLTVVQATPSVYSVENIGNSPFYGIPEHAKPLMEHPTEVLKLKNVLDPEAFSLLSEVELEEILEDVRIECARFGTVNSLNVVKHHDNHVIQESCQAPCSTGSASNNKDMESELCGGHMDCELHEISTSEVLHDNLIKHIEVDKKVEGDGTSGDELIADIAEDQMDEAAPLDSNIVHKEPICENNPNAGSSEFDDQLKDRNGDKIDNNDMKWESKVESESKVLGKLELEETEGKRREMSAGTEYIERLDLGDVEKVENEETVFDLEGAFEPGCILVEYKRAEASSMAAHCLQGRVFDDRIVSVEYVAFDIYRARFPN